MRVIAFVAFAAMCCGTVLAALVPAKHGDFAHYTFALTWQPGICSTDGGCRSDQPRAPLIGLHGLWASRPQQLIRRGITDPQWWSKGCDYYVHSAAPPPIDARLRRTLYEVMPHFRQSLLTHEYDKHVQCFGFGASAFFTTELAMRHAVAAGSFGRFLISQTGHVVTRAAVSARFLSAFSTDEARSLQLQCGRNRAGQTVLTQFWITIRTSELAAFPRAVSLMNSPVNEDTCPATFRVPAWQ
jgi:ribonuclease I